MRPRWLTLKPVVPPCWKAVSPRWMTDVIRQHHPDAKVSEVRLVEQAEDINRRARFALRYARGTGPDGVFVKTHGPAMRWEHMRSGELFGEARLFASGMPLPIEHPTVYRAVPDYPRVNALLVMEDMTTRGGDFRDATRPMTVDQVADGLRGLARLHRQYWGITPKSHPPLRWLKPWSVDEGWRTGLMHRLPIGLARTHDRLPAAIKDISSHRVIELWSRYLDSLMEGEPTLLHGEACICNSYVMPGDKVGFHDWQLVRRGNWARDTAYFLVSALTIEDRRANERRLLEIYRDALQLPDGQAPSMDEIWRRYRQTHVLGLTNWLARRGKDGVRAPAISEALIDRYAAAFVETDTLGALDDA
ncbi:MAG TPA: oxidoreductase family protein [Sphingobium sp.]|nr:oxidoreductase family protein [Sphingobium sp.]